MKSQDCLVFARVLCYKDSTALSSDHKYFKKDGAMGMMVDAEDMLTEDDERPGWSPQSRKQYRLLGIIEGSGLQSKSC